MTTHVISPLLLMAGGIVLWISAGVAEAGSAIQTNGVALLAIGAVWLVVECLFPRVAQQLAVVERDDARER